MLDRCTSVLTLGRTHVRCSMDPTHDGLCRSVLRNVPTWWADDRNHGGQTHEVSVMLTWKAQG